MWEWMLETRGESTPVAAPLVPWSRSFASIDAALEWLETAMLPTQGGALRLIGPWVEIFLRPEIVRGVESYRAALPAGVKLPSVDTARVGEVVTSATSATPELVELVEAIERTAADPSALPSVAISLSDWESCSATQRQAIALALMAGGRLERSAMPVKISGRTLNALEASGLIALERDAAGVWSAFSTSIDDDIELEGAIGLFCSESGLVAPVPSERIVVEDAAEEVAAAEDPFEVEAVAEEVAAEEGAAEEVAAEEVAAEDPFEFEAVAEEVAAEEVVAEEVVAEEVAAAAAPAATPIPTSPVCNLCGVVGMPGEELTAGACADCVPAEVVARLRRTLAADPAASFVSVEGAVVEIFDVELGGWMHNRFMSEATAQKIGAKAAEAFAAGGDVLAKFRGTAGAMLKAGRA